jgi:CubicO group peptidase (beta-lactamase class C family)
MSAQKVRRAAELVKRWVDAGDMQGIVVLVARRGTIILHEVFGKLAPEENAPALALDALFPIASMTKLITATAIMVLVEEGRVGLNRPVAEYIPEFGGEGKDAVLVHHLLTHTSGLNEEALEAHAKERTDTVAVPPAPTTLHPLINEYLWRRCGCPLWKPPGEEMSYADFNFDLAGEIVRRVSGRALDEFARERIFQPLGMKDTYYCRSDAPGHRRVRRQPDPTVDQSVEAVFDSERVCQGGGRAWSTAMDLAIFGQMFLDGGAYGGVRVLSPASVTAMTRNQIPGVSARFLEEYLPEASWGLGWSIHGRKTGLCGALYSAEAFEHWGNGGTYLWVDPVYAIVGVYFSIVPTGIYTDPWRNDLFADAVTAAVMD